MYGASALKALVTFAGFLLPALLIFLAVTLLARILRRREQGDAADVLRRLSSLEAEVADLRRRLEGSTARREKV